MKSKWQKKLWGLCLSCLLAGGAVYAQGPESVKAEAAAGAAPKAVLASVKDNPGMELTRAVAAAAKDDKIEAASQAIAAAVVNSVASNDFTLVGSLDAGVLGATEGNFSGKICLQSEPKMKAVSVQVMDKPEETVAYMDYAKDVEYLKYTDNKWYGIKIKDLLLKKGPEALAKYEKKLSLFTEPLSGENKLKLENSLRENLAERITNVKVLEEKKGEKRYLITSQASLFNHDTIENIISTLSTAKAKDKKQAESIESVLSYLKEPVVQDILTKKRDLKYYVTLNAKDNTLASVEVPFAPYLSAMAGELMDNYTPKNIEEMNDLTVLRAMMSIITVDANLEFLPNGKRTKVDIPKAVKKEAITDINKFPKDLKQKIKSYIEAE